MAKLTVSNGKLLFGGAEFAHIGVNAPFLISDALAGGSRYLTDLATLESKGVRIIRVIAGPTQSSGATGWATLVGSTTPSNASFYTVWDAFLTEAAARNISVIPTLLWNYWVYSDLKSETGNNLGTASSAMRGYMTDFVTEFVTRYASNNAVAAWGIGNEWMNYAWTGATPPGHTSSDQITEAMLVNAVPAIAATIKAIDSTRIVIPPNGNVGHSQSVTWRNYANRMLSCSYGCDVVAVHMYPDLRTSTGTYHAFIGDEYESAEMYLKELRSVCVLNGKPLVVEEVNAEYDDPSDSIAPAAYDAIQAAGIELTLDWGWYNDLSGYLGDLAAARATAMADITARNASLPQSWVKPTRMIPLDKARPIPSTSAKGNGSNARISIAGVAALEPTGAFGLMFWLKKNSALPTSRRIIAKNTGTTGWRINADTSTGENVELNVAKTDTTFVSTSGANLRVPVNEWHHLVFHFNGTQNFSIWYDGFMHAYLTAGSSFTQAPATGNAMYLMSAADGTSPSDIQLCDVMFINGTISDAEVVDYITRGVVPSNVNSRWKLNGDVLDSIGGRNGTALGSLTYVTNYLGSQ